MSLRIQKVLVPLDGSIHSEWALEYVKMLARKAPVSVELLRCFEPPATIYSLPDLEYESGEVLSEPLLRQRMQEYLNLRESELDGLPCQTTVVCGPPAERIIEQADRADLVVMSRHGRRGVGQWLLASVSTKVARAVRKPVLLVPPGDLGPFKLETILVCLDGSEIAERALDEAMKLAFHCSAKLILYRFVPLLSAADPEGDLLEARAYLKELKERHGEVVSQVFAQPGAVSNHIVEAADELNVDLVVLGSHGRQGVARWLLGSVAEHVLHHLKRPVMIVH